MRTLEWITRYSVTVLLYYNSTTNRKVPNTHINAESRQRDISGRAPPRRILYSRIGQVLKTMLREINEYLYTSSNRKIKLIRYMDF